MSILQAVLIALFSYLAAECVPVLMGDFGGYYVLSKPLASGLIVGIILGDVSTGVTVGAAVQTVYLATMSVGGSIQTDIAVVAYPAVALGVVSGGDANVSIALATTLGIVGILIWNGMEFCNVFWGNMAVKAAEKGDYKGVIKYHVFGAQLTFVLWCRLCNQFDKCCTGLDHSCTGNCRRRITSCWYHDDYQLVN